MATIRLDRVWKRYGPIEAVRELSLTCADGEMLALLGPSGCGKTSTLKMVAGIEEVSEGEILFDERPVSRLAPAERNIAMVFEDYALYPHLSVFENIAFPLRIRRLPGTRSSCYPSSPNPPRLSSASEAYRPSRPTAQSALPFRCSTTSRTSERS